MASPMSAAYCSTPMGDAYCATPAAATVHPPAAHNAPLSDVEMAGVVALLVVVALAVRYRVRRWWWPS